MVKTAIDFKNGIEYDTIKIEKILEHLVSVVATAEAGLAWAIILDSGDQRRCRHDDVDCIVGF